MAKKKASKRVNKKHYLIFNNKGVVSITTPKDWARGNMELFPQYNFEDSDNTPIVNVIEDYLQNNLGFHFMENNEMVIYYQYLAL